MDRQSDLYRYGTYAGQTYNIATMVANPAGAASWAIMGMRVINGMSMASSMIDAAQAARNGNYQAAAMMGLNGGLSMLRGAGSPCMKGAATWAQRGLHAYGVAQGAVGGIEKIYNGDYLGGLLDIAGSAASTYRMLQACFAAGTPLLTPDGDKLIEQFKVGDLLLSRSEFDPDGAVEAKVVEEVFVNEAEIFHLHVPGQVIRTTAEHPFYVLGKGWTAARDLQIGDVLLSHDGRQVPVEDLLETGERETVYNLRIADYHTYFVGGSEWGFSVWAHNACVYQATDRSGVVRYVGIANTGATSTLGQRLGAAQARALGLKAGVLPGFGNLTPMQAKQVEQALIDYHGRQTREQGGSLLNDKGGLLVTPSNTSAGYSLLRQLGYWNNRMFSVQSDGYGI